MGLFLKKAEEFLQKTRGKKLLREKRTEKAIELTSLLLLASFHEKTLADKRQEAWMAKMIKDPKGRAFTTALMDLVFRSRSLKRTADQLIYLIHKFKLPQFLNVFERVQFYLFVVYGLIFPGFFVPLIRKKIRKEMATVLLPEDEKKQIAYFERCRKDNIRINLNHLGEAILGEKESEARLKTYLDDLANPLIEYISVKISTIYSQINMIAFDETLGVLAERLRLLYRTAQKHHFKRSDGSSVEKFVNLDMEEYKDLELTIALFQNVLSEEEFLHTQAGIVLQSYLPDAFIFQKSLTEWAKNRVHIQGGAPIKVRLVKGANLSMEQVESSQRLWSFAPFDSKAETDANFKRMLEYGSSKENAEAVHLGVASHNLFDIAYALLLRAENETEELISFEMLEGMALPLRRVVKKLTGSILLYCPEAKEKDMHSAAPYLIRRLDENCGKENFLRSFFELKPNNASWNEQVLHFTESFPLIKNLRELPKREQNRKEPPKKQELNAPFKNEADTDFSLKDNREWAEAIFLKWQTKKHAPIPLVIAGEEITSTLEVGIDPSRPHEALYQYSLADIPLIERAIHCAKENAPSWANLAFSERTKLLGQAAQVFREKREDLIGAMIADGGKTVWEADPEVSEAVDFIEYYRKNWEEELKFADLKWQPKGTVLVTPPWNFPCSIPVSGIAAALTAGNCVLFKPAPEAVLVGWTVVQAFWQAGISRQVLQFINCKEESAGSYLVSHPDIASVILTGSTQTAKKFIGFRQGLDLHAETGGKNAIIVTEMSDRDLAVKDIINSAFGHSGQKCSACSLAILEAEVYDDPQFKKQLLDAAASLTVASAWDKRAKIIPLIRPPENSLFRGLTQLEEGEEWLLEPKACPENPHLWTPGIKWGVRPNSFTHQTELFGHVLGVMRAQNLDVAIRLANATPYGLTSGLHSLDEREHVYWKAHIVAGNLYINRGITGAIVRRQPFGGCKDSGFGMGAKAGGPNYVKQLAIPSQVELPKEKAALPACLVPLISHLSAFELSEHEQNIWKASAENYAHVAEILKTPSDLSKVLGEANYFYLIPQDKVYVRLGHEENLLPLLQVIAASLICQTPLEISSSKPLPLPPLSTICFTIEEEEALLNKNPRRIRLISPPSLSLKQKCAERGIILLDQPVLPHGRVELLHYLREISLSTSYHRYGYISDFMLSSVSYNRIS